MGPRAHDASGRAADLAGAVALLLVAAACDGSLPNDGRDAGGEPDAGAEAGARDGGGTDAGWTGDGGEDAGSPEDAALDAGAADDAGTPADPCEAIEGARYETLSREGPPTDRPPAMHADLNVRLRGWEPTGGVLGLVDVDGPTDELAPHLNTLFEDDRVPTFARNYRVYDWDWSTNRRAGPSTAWEVTIAGMATAPGEVLEVPDSGYDIGGGHEVLVLFADDASITLKYTREDDVVFGYTVHVHGVCVEPSLRALYDASDAAGRGSLPALRGEQPFGRARGAEIQVAIRDTGAFMDPRVRKDWW